MFINNVEVPSESLDAAALAILGGWTTGETYYYEELEAIVGVDLHPGEIPLNSSEWRGYTHHRTTLKNAVNKSLSKLASDESLGLDFAALSAAKNADGEAVLVCHRNDAVADACLAHHRKKLKSTPANLIKDLNRVKKYSQLTAQAKNEVSKAVWIAAVQADAIDNLLAAAERRARLPKTTIQRIMLEAVEAPKDGSKAEEE